MELSHLQHNILEHIGNRTDNLIIRGVAGCGKTTTLRLAGELLKGFSSSLRLIYMTFSSEMVKSVTPDLQHCFDKVSTIHSLGMGSLTSQIGKVKVNKWKYWNIIGKEHGFYPLQTKDIVGILEILRHWAIRVDNITWELVDEALAHHDIVVKSTFDEHGFTQAVIGWLKQGIWNKEEIDFVDMLYIPWYKQMSLPYYDYCLIDETQDLTPLMQEVVKMLDGIIIAVGDPFQAIYAFMGADEQSYYNVKAAIDAVELPLSVCYRCPEPVIDLAQEYVPEMQGTGKPGEFNEISYESFNEHIRPGDLVLCRWNAPNFERAFELMKAGTPVQIKGQDFMQQLIAFIDAAIEISDSWGNHDHCLKQVLNDRLANARLNGRRAVIKDQYNCISYIACQSDSYRQLAMTVRSLFDTNPKRTVNFSSIHRSKGLQNPRVFIQIPEDGCLPGAGQGQESNLSYVALTRSQEQLFLVQPKEEEVW